MIAPRERTAPAPEPGASANTRGERRQAGAGRASSRLGLAWLVVLVTASVLAPVLVHYGATATNPASVYLPPGPAHWFGTDQYGRDIFVRTLVAARLDLSIAAGVTAASFTVGCTLGAIFGYVGGLTDTLGMRVVDVLLSFPAFILAILITAVLHGGVGTVMAAVALAYVPYFVRLTRGEMLSRKAMTYAEAARCVGLSDFHILFLHLLPNCLGPALTQASLTAGYAMLDVAGLSFLGLGIRPPTAEWGVMITEGAGDVFAGQWWTSFFPGLFVFLTVMAFNLIGEWRPKAEAR